MLVSVQKDCARPFQSAAYRATCYTLHIYKDVWPAGALVPVSHAVSVGAERDRRSCAEMAREAVHRHHCTLAEATRQIRILVAEAREEYRAGP